MMPNMFDWAIVAFIVIVAVAEIFFLPLLRRNRIVAYAYMSVYLWTAAIAVVILWVIYGRAWSLLFLGDIVPWRLAVGFVLATAFIAFLLYQRTLLSRHPRAMERLLRQAASIEWMFPTTQRESAWTIFLSITAGVTEEILFRGFAIWLFSAFMPLWAAIAVSAVAFGLGHAYQNPKAIVATAVYGLAMTALVFLSGSLLPAVAVHVLQDIVSMEMGGMAKRRALAAEGAG